MGIVIVGAGGHGREVLGVARRLGMPVVGFLDDGSPDQKVLGRIGVPHLGGLNLTAFSGSREFVVGIGSGSARRRACESHLQGWEPVRLIDPTSNLDDDVRVGAGVVIFGNSTVTTNIDIGDHSHIGRGAAVGHDCRIGKYVTIMPMASVSGDVEIGDEAIVGAGAVIRQGQVIGAGAYVGAGAVVVKDVNPGEVVVGNPARPVGGNAP